MKGIVGLWMALALPGLRHLPLKRFKGSGEQSHRDFIHLPNKKKHNRKKK